MVTVFKQSPSQSFNIYTYKKNKKIETFSFIDSNGDGREILSFKRVVLSTLTRKSSKEIKQKNHIFSKSRFIFM